MIDNVRYADDTTLLCGNEKDKVMMEFLGPVEELSKKKGLLLNAKKTKIMVLDKNRTGVSKFHLTVQYLLRGHNEGSDREYSTGIQTGGKMIDNVRYADDTLLLCGNEKDKVMMELLGPVQELSKKKGLLLNAKKTKIMVLDKNRTGV